MRLWHSLCASTWCTCPRFALNRPAHPRAHDFTVLYVVTAAVFNGPCVWGPQSVELYYYRQVNRCQEAQSVPGCVPHVVLAPHQRDKTFVPRYICYQNAAGSTHGTGTGFAHGVPRIVITEHPPNLRHHHLSPRSRRHSAPGHITALTADRVPTTPGDTSSKQKLSDLQETKWADVSATPQCEAWCQGPTSLRPSHYEHSHSACNRIPGDFVKSQ